MRCDGRKVSQDEPIYFLIPYFLTHRYDAMNMITVDIPEEPLRSYMNQKRKEGRPVNHMALLITAYLRTLDKYPDLNRFIGGRTIYEHVDKTVSMVVLKPGGGESMNKIELADSDDLFSVQKKIESFVDVSRNEEDDQSLDKAIHVLLKLKPLLGFLMAILRFADRHGLLPRALVKASPFHASMLISNLASIRTNHIYHHVYEFGTTSVSVTIGTMHEVPKRTSEGVKFERCIPLGVVMDERIASGLYFANAFNYFRKLLAKPEQLEKLPEQEALTV
ncbi:MAG: hypothetical protein IKN89_06170 [Oscillospiraceae bacterium]|nr:hypothetical protein [Oscillospiraceae bacterium]